MESNLFMIRRKFSIDFSDQASDLELVSSLQDAVGSLIDSGKVQKAFNCMAQVLKIKVKYLGDEADEVTSYISYILKTVCETSLQLLENSKTQSSITLLKSALLLVNKYPNRGVSKEISQTLHTFSCALRKVGNLSLSEKYALKSLSFSKSKANEKLLSSIYLNLCNICSLQSDHRKAIKYCTLAVKLAEADYFNVKRTRPREYPFQEISVLAVAYHNLAVEEEHMKNYEVSLGWYRKAVKFLEKHSGSQHFNLLEQFKKSLEDANRARLKVYPRLDKSFKGTLAEDSFVEDMYLIKNTKNKTQSNFFKKKNEPRPESSDSAWTSTLKASGEGKVQESDPSVKFFEDSNHSKRSLSSASIKKMKLFERNRIFLDFHETFKPGSSLVSRQKARKESLKKSEFFLSSVIKIQSFFRKTRIRNWYLEVKNGSYIPKKSKCTRKVLGRDEEVTVQLVPSNFLVLISLKNSEQKYNLFEICDLLNSWTGDDFNKKFFKLFIFAEEGRLRPLPESSIKLQQRFIKESFLGGYRFLVYSVLNRQGQHIFFNAFSLNYSKEITHFLMVHQKDFASFLGLKVDKIGEELQKVRNFLKIGSEKGEIRIFLDKTLKLPSEKFNKSETNFIKPEKLFYKKPLRMEKAAVVIQKNFKMFQERRKFCRIRDFFYGLKLNVELQQFVSAVSVIQKFLRLWKRQKNSKIQAALVIQKQIRMKLQRKRFLGIKNAVNLVQRVARGFLARRRYKKLYLNVVSRKLLVQGINHLLVSHKQVKKDLNKTESPQKAARFIQKWYKGYETRKAFQVYRILCTSHKKTFPYLFNSILKAQKQLKLKKPSNKTILTQKFSKAQDSNPEIIIYYFNRSACLIQKWFKKQKTHEKFQNVINFSTSHAQKPVKPLKHMKSLKTHQLVQAALVIQRHIRGYLTRKSFKIQKLLNSTTHRSTVKAVLLVQKLFRGWKARKEFLDLRSGHLVIERNALIFDEVPYLISISKTSQEIVIKATDLIRFTSLFHKFDLEQSIPEILDHLVISEGLLRVEKTHKNISFKFLLYQEKKVIEWEHYLISIFLEPDCYLISATGSFKPMHLRLNFSELVERYSECIEVKDIMNDLIIEPRNNLMMISSKVILLKKSKYFQDKLYTINMYQKGNDLIFEIMFDSNYKKRIPIDYNLAARETGINNGKIVLGMYIIDNCLLIHGKKVNILFKMKKISDQTQAIIKVQARIRSFLTRKRLSGKHLVLVCEREMNKKVFKIYCHYFASKYEIIARNSNSTLFLVLEKKLSHEQMLLYLRKTIIPNLQVTSFPEKLIMKVTIPNPEKFIFKPRNCSSQGFNKNVMARDDGSMVQLAKVMNRNQSLDKPLIRIRKERTSNIDEILKSSGANNLSPPLTPLLALKKQEPLKQEIIRSQELEKIVFKSALNLSGIYLIVSMQLQGKGIYIQALNESGTLELELFVKAKNVDSMSTPDIENLCKQILSKLKLVSGVDNKLKLTIEDSKIDQRDQVIYRRRHFISGRYFTVTVFENIRGVFLQANDCSKASVLDNDKSDFRLTLGKLRVGNSQNLQEELNSLVKRLRIQTFFGQEILVVST